MIAGARVVANVNPKLLFERLVAPEHVDADFRARIAALPLRLGHVPDERRARRRCPISRACRARTRSRTTRSGIIIAPSLAYMERAYFDAKTHGWSRAPIVEVLIPSVVDDSLAPPGMHVASLFCQHAHPDLPRCGRARPGTTRATRSPT